MGWFDDERDSHQAVYGDGDYEQKKHEGKFSHELIGGAAAFEGMKLYEDNQRKKGEQVNHAFAKELLMGFVGGEVEKLVETKGLDEVDAIKARKHAKQQAEAMYDDHYGGQDQYDPDRAPPDFSYNQNY